MTTIEPLPGGLNDSLMLNSNHPESVTGPGIAVSTLPWPGEAHLNQPFTGEFAIFAHHRNRSRRTLHLVAALYAPQPATVAVGPSACFTTSQAPYRDRGSGVSGPGHAVADALLRDRRPAARISLAAGAIGLLHHQQVPAGDEVTCHFLLNSDAPVYPAVLFLAEGPANERIAAALQAGRLLPRQRADLLPTLPGVTTGPLIYGRVAGVQMGTTWLGELRLARGTSRAFLLNGKQGRSEGTGQVQAAPLARRYPDSAYAAHGNYGVLYDLAIAVPGGCSVFFDTPADPVVAAQEASLRARLARYRGGRTGRKAFRGAIEVSREAPAYVNVIQGFGRQGETPLATADELRLRLFYPANAAPPHILRICTGE